jgi:hypothetical protein
MTTLDAKHVFIKFANAFRQIEIYTNACPSFCPLVYNAQWEGKKIVLL